MRKAIRPFHSFELRLLSGIVLGVVLAVVGVSATVSAQSSGEDWYQTQAIEAADLGISDPVGVAYSAESDTLFAFSSADDGTAVTDFVRLSTLGDALGTGSSVSDIPDPLSVAYYEPTDSLFYLDTRTNELVGVTVGPQGDLAPASQTTTRFNANAYGLRQALGITFDAANRRLFVLDVAGSVPVLVRVAADPQNSFDGDSALSNGRLDRIRLTELRGADVRGIAFNPQDGHLYILGVADNAIYELTTDGELVSTRDISSLGLQSPEGLVFAASADRTDDPANMNLFIADSGSGGGSTGPTTSASVAGAGQIVELSFQQAAAPTALDPASLVQIIDTSKAAWNPSSPDPAGIAYRPATAGLLISDSEVEENHPDFQGFNVFESTTSGSLFATCATTDFSNEPTGAAVNTTNGHIFFADDNANAVFEVGLGPDGTYCTADDTASSLSTSAFGAGDPEALAHGNNKLFIGDGVNQEIYIVDLGADGMIGGTGADADVLESQFDTFALGLRDPEGLEYNPINGTLFIVSTVGTDDFLVQTTTGGVALNSWDLAFLGRVPRSGLAYGPGSVDPGVNTIYMASRGVDNGADPNENDGKVYELNIGSGEPPPAPTADFSGAPLSGDLPLTVSFTDLSTGFPTSWSWDFGDTNTSTEQSPTHTYTAAGTYTVALTVTNVSGSDTMTKVDYITVTVPPPPVADFSGSPVSGNAPLTVSFTDLSTGSPTSWSWDFGDTNTSTEQNPTHTYTTAGTYTVVLTATNAGGSDTMTKVDYISVTVPPPNPLYASLASNGIVGGVNAADDDILWFDGSTWSLYFDGSDIGIQGDLVAFHIIDANNILMSFSKDNTFGAVTIEDHDVALFTATSLGQNTAGTFSLYLDGDTADLTTPSEDVDAVHLLADGRLIVSTLGTPSLAGVADPKDEDLFAFTPTVPGDYTGGGTWEMYFDASDVGISGGSDVIAVSIATNGDLYLSTDNTVTTGGITADDEDVFVCGSPTTGPNSACGSTSLYFDGSLWALEVNDIDGIALP